MGVLYVANVSLVFLYILKQKLKTSTIKPSTTELFMWNQDTWVSMSLFIYLDDWGTGGSSLQEGSCALGNETDRAN